MTEPADWLGREIADSTGTRYGRLDELFVGRETGEPEFGIVTVPLAGGGGTKRVAVPMGTASLRGDTVVLPLDPARVKAAPEIQGEVERIPPESGQRVLAFFGMAGDAPTIPIPTVSPEAETVLSEERLDVSTETRAVERVRIRKQVVTEEVTVTVEVRREELVIEREPIPRDAVGAPEGGAFEESAETVIVLHAEEPVVGRRVVPVERVRLRRDNVIEQISLTEPVRKEHAEVEHTAIEQENPS